MNLSQLVSAHQIALTVAAVNFDLDTREGRKHSHGKLRELFVELQRVADPAICLEIGANDARFSRQVVSRLRAGVPVIAFEANPYTYKQRISEFDFQKYGVRYVNCAITETDGPIEFRIQKSRGGHGLSPTLGDNSLLKRERSDIEYEVVTVEGVTIPSFLEANKLQDGLISTWIDVEGAAKLVLSGIEPVIDRFITIMIEVEDARQWQDQWTSDKVFAHLMQRGFVPVARDFEYPQQYNVIFVRPEIVSKPSFGQTLSSFYAHLRQ